MANLWTVAGRNRKENDFSFTTNQNLFSFQRPAMSLGFARLGLRVFYTNQPKGNHSNENENHLFPKERNLHFHHAVFPFGPATMAKPLATSHVLSPSHKHFPFHFMPVAKENNCLWQEGQRMMKSQEKASGRAKVSRNMNEISHLTSTIDYQRKILCAKKR